MRFFFLAVSCLAVASAFVMDEHVGKRVEAAAQRTEGGEHWIVEVEHGHNDAVLQQLNLKAGGNFKVKYNWRGQEADDLHALSVKGISRAEAEAIPGVKKVHSVNRYEMTAAAPMSWGLDRIDQASLPLSESYTPAYNGCGVDVYVLDCGIDTNHPEFASGGPFNREVKNIWDVYNNMSFTTTDSDLFGHGTHVAGTVGGNEVGVAKCANIHGMQVFQGLGAWSDDIYEAFQVVKKIHRNKENAKSVVSMSLGGKCPARVAECTDDIMIAGISELTRKGIVVVVAAGNSALKAQNFLPASVPSAITVGASMIDDTIAPFSNFGSAVDIFAPGTSINSACARMRYFPCDPSGYTLLSGTSMATPHVSGVVAQLLEKADRPMRKFSDVQYITNMLLETAVDKVILGDEKHTTVKLLQVAPGSLRRA